MYKTGIRKIFSVFVTFAVAFCLSYGSEAELITYDKDVLSNITTCVNYVELNDNRSLSIVIEVENKGLTDTTGYTMYEATLTFGGKYKFDISKAIKNKTILAGACKLYKVKIPAKKVSKNLTIDELNYIVYDFNFKYTTGDYNHDEHVWASTFAVVEKEEDGDAA